MREIRQKENESMLADSELSGVFSAFFSKAVEERKIPRTSN